MLRDDEVETVRNAITWLKHLAEFVGEKVVKDDIDRVTNELKLMHERMR